MENEKVITHVELLVNADYISEVVSRAAETRDKILLEEGCEEFNLTKKKTGITLLSYLQYILPSNLTTGIWSKIILNHFLPFWTENY